MLVPVYNINELKKVLVLQQTITWAANKELMSLTGEDTSKFIRDAKRLLAKYAEYPTLTEFKNDSQLTNMYKWGATFGVAALTGTLVLEETAKMQPQFSAVVREMFFILLRELDQPRRKYVIDALLSALKGRLTVEGTAKQQASHSRLLVSNLVETYISLSVQFGLMQRSKDKVSLTSTGKRVLLHLVDAVRFIEEISKAHQKFSMK